MSLLEQDQPDLDDRAQVTIHPNSQGGVQQRMQVVTTLMRYRGQIEIRMPMVSMRVLVTRYAMVRMRLCPAVVDGVRQR